MQIITFYIQSSLIVLKNFAVGNVLSISEIQIHFFAMGIVQILNRLFFHGPFQYILRRIGFFLCTYFYSPPKFDLLLAYLHRAKN